MRRTAGISHATRFATLWLYVRSVAFLSTRLPRRRGLLRNYRSCVGHQQHQMQWVGGGGLEIVMKVEVAGAFVEGMYQQCSNADDLGCLHGPGNRIAQQVRAETVTLFLAVHGQPTEQDHRYR